MTDLTLMTSTFLFNSQHGGIVWHHANVGWFYLRYYHDQTSDASERH